MNTALIPPLQSVPDAVNKWLDSNCKRVAWDIEKATYEITDVQGYELVHAIDSLTDGRAGVERTPQDYAIEHAEYMALGAEHLMRCVNAEADARGAWESAEDDDEKELREATMQEAAGVTAEAIRSMAGGIYEFRKRRDRALAARIGQQAPSGVAPIDMILFCPKCGEQHVDAPEMGKLISSGPAAGRVRSGWTNPPHKSHLCHGCGCIWRPADVATNGVEAIKTTGQADNFTDLAAPPLRTVGDPAASPSTAPTSSPCAGDAPEVTVEVSEPTEVRATVEAMTLAEYTVLAEREDIDKNWYITVIGPDGIKGYDGYWRDSYLKTPEEVIAEAIKGAALSASPPAQADEAMSDEQILDIAMRGRKSGPHWNWLCSLVGYEHMRAFCIEFARAIAGGAKP